MGVAGGRPDSVRTAQRISIWRSPAYELLELITFSLEQESLYISKKFIAKIYNGAIAKRQASGGGDEVDARVRPSNGGQLKLKSVS